MGTPKLISKATCTLSVERGSEGDVSSNPKYRLVHSSRKAKKVKRLESRGEYC
jgi:hypothetical protein